MKLENERLNVTIITDGASTGNPGPSGYAAIIQINSGNSSHEERIISGGFSQSTNNVSKVTAVLEHSISNRAIKYHDRY